MIHLSAVIIAFNEERHIGSCLESLAGVADEILVVDSFSTDRTAEICEKYNVKFIRQKFMGYIEQKNFAMAQAGHHHILSLDADEALSEELKKSILEVKKNWEHEGYEFRRLNNYCGKWIHYGGLYPSRKLRLFDRRKGRWQGINPHDSFLLEDGKKAGFLKGYLHHWIYESIEDHIQKVNRFSSIAANEYHRLGITAPLWKILIKPVWRFLYSFLFTLGFLHGESGFVISRNLALQCFLKYGKLRNLLNNQCPDTDANGNSLQGSNAFPAALKHGLSPGTFVSVIMTTYNQPEWLKKVLWGFEVQTHRNFEIIIADDGSGSETKSVVDEFMKNSPLKIKHVWHPDEGYQKCLILNKGIMASEAEYIVFTDGDCIPRNDFIQTHVEHAREGCFLSGGAIRLPNELSHLVSKEDIASQRAFDLRWLVKRGLPGNMKRLKLIRKEWFSNLMNTITPTKSSWNGGNSSVWKKYIYEVNGFNEDMLYGGQDREFGERLYNLGLTSKQIRYSAVCLHLDHGRPYKTRESIKRNIAIRKSVRVSKNIQTPNGLIKLHRQN